MNLNSPRTGRLKELIFIGLGLNDEKGISVKGLEETKTADTVFMETYTSRMPDFNLQQFEELCNRKVQLVGRRELEEENGNQILQAAKNGKTVFLVPGDPFIATTHVTLRIDAEKQGVPYPYCAWCLNYFCNHQPFRITQLQVWQNCNSALPRKL